MSGRKRIEKLLAEDALLMRGQQKSKTCWDAANVMTKPMMKLMNDEDKANKEAKKKKKKDKKTKKKKG